MATLQVRKMVYQNPSSNKLYHVVFFQNADGSVTGTARLTSNSNNLNRPTTDPNFDNTEVTFVVKTTKTTDVFGAALRTNAYLAAASIYDASNAGAAGALLSTLLV